ncbi:MAG TPA: COX15/CtaA family protein [Blastocatellia bacterium]|nr:COX15/CtaA family protein [Blastocatellia bacterium]
MDSSNNLKANVAKEHYGQFGGIHFLTIVLGLVTVLLLIAGGLVTSNVAGDSVPDWPLSLGRWVLFGSRGFVGNVRYEYTHRAIAGAVTVATALVALWAWVSPSLRKRFGWLTAAALGGVLAQAGLGGVRVLLPEYKAPIAIVHALVAQGFFCLVISLWVVTSNAWNSSRPTGTDTGNIPLRTVSAVTVGAILVQLVLGAGFRHGVLGIGWHIGGAVAVTALIGLTAHSAARRHKSEPYIRRPAIVLSIFLLCQLGLGIGAYISRVASVNDPQPLEPMVYLTVAHVVVGALTLASALVLALRCRQVLSAASSEGVVGPAAPYASGLRGGETGRA